MGSSPRRASQAQSQSRSAGRGRSPERALFHSRRSLLQSERGGVPSRVTRRAWSRSRVHLRCDLGASRRKCCFQHRSGRRNLHHDRGLGVRARVRVGWASSLGAFRQSKRQALLVVGHRRQRIRHAMLPSRRVVPEVAVENRRVGKVVAIQVDVRPRGEAGGEVPLARLIPAFVLPRTSMRTARSSSVGPRSRCPRSVQNKAMSDGFITRTRIALSRKRSGGSGIMLCADRDSGAPRPQYQVQML
jgi:hypothetical protein